MCYQRHLMNTSRQLLNFPLIAGSYDEIVQRSRDCYRLHMYALDLLSFRQISDKYESERTVTNVSIAFLSQKIENLFPSTIVYSMR